MIHSIHFIRFLPRLAHNTLQMDVW